METLVGFLAQYTVWLALGSTVCFAVGSFFQSAALKRSTELLSNWVHVHNEAGIVYPAKGSINLRIMGAVLFLLALAGIALKG